ncbi:MAG: hypothetical protein KBC57_13765 [Neisseriaceae bacterium]|nr:hypothetical protein [Neisseriaceae bacterium]
MIKEQILAILISKDEIQDSTANGVARLAIDKGYDQLSNKQKYVVDGFLTGFCEGDPILKDCNRRLEDELLLEALEEEIVYGRLMCSDCRHQTDHQVHTWSRMEKE